MKREPINRTDKTARRPWWIAAVAVAACAALVIGAVAAWPLISSDGDRPDVEPPQGNVTTTTSEQETTEEGQTTDPTVESDPEPSDTVTESTEGTDGESTEPSATTKPPKTTAESSTKPTTKSTKPTKPTTTVSTTRPTATTADDPLPNGALLAEPKIPTMVKKDKDNYDEWTESRREQEAKIRGQTDGMTDFYADTIAQFLKGNKGENRVYSPLNVYMALSMLAETADGNTRKQITDLLGVSDLSALRKKTAALWNGVYVDDGLMVSRLGNSLWLDNKGGYGYKSATVERLAKSYYASVYQGDMDSDAYNQQLRGWLNDQTDGLLKNQVQGVKFPMNCVLTLASTVCFKAGWKGEFYLTEEEPFYTVNGEKTCQFMKKSEKTTAYFGNRFTAVAREMDNGAFKMIFFLPDEDSSTDELIRDQQVLALMEGRTGKISQARIKVNMSIPKFDVTANYGLDDGLKALGVTDLYDKEKRDLGGIFKNPAIVDGVGASHAARVKIDEEGVEAAAYTLITYVKRGTTTQKLQEIDFVLDRPFVFAITGPEDVILFTGVVENP